MTVFLPAWADAVEGRELILCSESMVAKTIEVAVGAWPEKDRLPVALIDRCTGTMNEPVSPFSTVWAVTRGTRDARFALPWCAPTSIPGEPTVRVLKLPEEMRGFDPLVEACKDRSSFCISSAPECVENMAAIIAAEKDHQPLAVVMADVLGQPGLHPTTRRLLLDAVSARTGLAPEAIVPEGFNPWTGGPYALNAAGGTTYIAREGWYWRRGSREKDFTPVTNFRGSAAGRPRRCKGKVTHHASLEINGRTVESLILKCRVRQPQTPADRADHRCRPSRCGVSSRSGLEGEAVAAGINQGDAGEAAPASAADDRSDGKSRLKYFLVLAFIAKTRRAIDPVARMLRRVDLRRRQGSDLRARLSALPTPPLINA